MLNRRMANIWTYKTVLQNKNNLIKPRKGIIHSLHGMDGGEDRGLVIFFSLWQSGILRGALPTSATELGAAWTISRSAPRWGRSRRRWGAASWGRGICCLCWSCPPGSLTAPPWGRSLAPWTWSLRPLCRTIMKCMLELPILCVLENPWWSSCLISSNFSSSMTFPQWMKPSISATSSFGDCRMSVIRSSFPFGMRFPLICMSWRKSITRPGTNRAVYSRSLWNCLLFLFHPPLPESRQQESWPNQGLRRKPLVLPTAVPPRVTGLLDFCGVFFSHPHEIISYPGSSMKASKDGSSLWPPKRKIHFFFGDPSTYSLWGNHWCQSKWRLSYRCGYSSVLE